MGSSTTLTLSMLFFNSIIKLSTGKRSYFYNSLCPSVGQSLKLMLSFNSIIELPTGTFIKYKNI